MSDSENQSLTSAPALRAEVLRFAQGKRDVSYIFEERWVPDRLESLSYEGAC